MNFTIEGDFWTGRQYKTFEIFPKLSKGAAVDSLAASIASNGFQITNSNKDLGLISANQTVSFGQGKTVPLNAIVKSTPTGGVRAELVLSLSGGLSVSADDVKKDFCQFLEEVGNVKQTQVVKSTAGSNQEATDKPAKTKESSKARR